MRRRPALLGARGGIGGERGGRGDGGGEGGGADGHAGGAGGGVGEEGCLAPLTYRHTPATRAVLETDVLMTAARYGSAVR